MKIFAPILNNSQAQELEKSILGNSRFATWQAMERAGIGTGKMFLKEFASFLPASPKVLCLAGSGHNGGDALIAAREICSSYADCNLTLAIAPKGKMKTATLRALADIQRTFGGASMQIVDLGDLKSLENTRFDLLIEGLTGMSFTPPARESLAAEIESANNICAKIKLSIDIPAGAHGTPQTPVFKADITYAAGIAKSALFAEFNRPFAGRIRYVDIGFFDGERGDFADSKDLIVRPNALDFLTALRPSISDKRGYGHLFIIGGSRSYPAAVLMNVRAAIRGGCGLVTAFVPETFVSAFAAQEPSAIWVGCPEDESGAIALEAFGLIRARLKSATAILAGSGMTNSKESIALLCEVLKVANLPIVIDADAVCAQILECATACKKVLATPHEGEFLRLSADVSDSSLRGVCKKYSCAIALKSSCTRISDGDLIVRSTRGSPALARAGSGDILAGLAGSLLAARKDMDAIEIGACASQWLGLAAESAAAKFGAETPLATSDIVKFLPSALADLA